MVKWAWVTHHTNTEGLGVYGTFPVSSVHLAKNLFSSATSRLWFLPGSAKPVINFLRSVGIMFALYMYKNLRGYESDPKKGIPLPRLTVFKQSVFNQAFGQPYFVDVVRFGADGPKKTVCIDREHDFGSLVTTRCPLFC